jgi:hypothetical protein
VVVQRSEKIMVCHFLHDLYAFVCIIKFASLRFGYV